MHSLFYSKYSSVFSRHYTLAHDQLLTQALLLAAFALSLDGETGVLALVTLECTLVAVGLAVGATDWRVLSRAGLRTVTWVLNW